MHNINFRVKLKDKICMYFSEQSCYSKQCLTQSVDISVCIILTLRGTFSVNMQCQSLASDSLGVRTGWYFIRHCKAIAKVCAGGQSGLVAQHFT